MADAGASGNEPSHGLVRARGAARRGGDDHAGLVPVARVVVYTARGCTLCEPALETLRDARVRLGFELDVVEIDGEPTLEARYRELLPVVEIDGEQAFVHFVDPDALRERLADG